ncbi:Protein saf4 [Yarrowia sp. B02]|nr:Protein saf4 [Yarrowia sp. B02]
MSQATNKYYPPDYDGKSSANQLAGAKTTKPTVRFELPQSAKCHGCEKTIAQGVRFNAVKTRNGSYLSSPIWRFAIKHAECGHPIVIETDPKNASYVTVEGATFKTVIKTEEETPSNPFEAVEREVAKQKAKEQVKQEETTAEWTFKSSILSAEDSAKETQKMYDEHLHKARLHQDLSYEMRNRFRGQKRLLEAQNREDNVLKDKMGLLRDLPLAKEAQVIVPSLERGQKAQQELRMKSLAHGGLFDSSSQGTSLAQQTRELSRSLQTKPRTKLKLRGIKKPAK